MLNIKTIKTVIISTVGILTLSGCSLFCGPNMSDVRVMKPMAEKISDYIVKNGIPESLKDIPDLPYELRGCERETTYGDERGRPQKYITKKASWIDVEEICNFKNITIRFELLKGLKSKDAEWYGGLRMKSNNETTLFSRINQYKKENFTLSEAKFKGRRSGICTPLTFKQ